MRTGGWYIIVFFTIVCSVVVKGETLDSSDHFDQNSIQRKRYESYLSNSLKGADTFFKKLIIAPELGFLWSTHNDIFKEINVTISYKFTLISCGIGIEFAQANSHLDNGWKLSNINFLPIYGDFRLHFSREKKIQPYFELAPGVSMISYAQERLNSAITSNVHQVGFFLYSGFGLSCKIKKNIQPSIALGLKNYHLSSNAYEINPHGIAVKAGLIFTINNR